MGGSLPFYYDYVQVNKYSRPGSKLVAHRGIVIHYTANRGATAEGHQDYFDGSDGGGGRYAGAHIFVDKDSAVCIIPLDEVGYHANEKSCKISHFKAKSGTYSGNANLTTIGIEMCIEKDGSFHPETVRRTQEVVRYLMDLFNIPLKYVVRHYDVTGKICPKPYVDSPSAWNSFKNGISSSKVSTASVSTASGQIGVVEVLVSSLNVRESASFSSEIVKVIHQGEKYKAYDKKNGLYNVGGDQWVSAGSKYVKFTPVPKDRLVIVDTPSLWTYNSKDWDDKAEVVHEGEAFTIVGEYTVGGGKMYQIKSGLYITANPKYVKVVDQ